jgi:hypothetical protein
MKTHDRQSDVLRMAPAEDHMCGACIRCTHAEGAHHSIVISIAVDIPRVAHRQTHAVAHHLAAD